MKNLASIFVILSAITLPCFANSATSVQDKPLYCKHKPVRGLTPDQEKICKFDPEQAAEEKRKAEELKPPKYPFIGSGYLMVDPSTGKQVDISLTSQDGSTIVVDLAKSDADITLKTSEILSWSSAHGGSGTDASAAVSTAVAGALFFWPMMLAAPFMVKNYTITGFKIDYIDETGSDKSLNFATILAPKPTMELLKFSTGLEPGVKRDDEVIKEKYKNGLKNSMAKLDKFREMLIVKNTKKPWCSYLKLKPNDSDSDKYSATLSHINSLRKKLGMDAYKDPSTDSSEIQWEEYLASKPGLKEWAAKYKQQSDALKNCETSQIKSK